MEREASSRVRQVVAQIDGTDWEAATRIKHSYPADLWFHAAGIDGVFNPIGHEPILVSGIPSFRLPFLMTHELAHVHGIADEGRCKLRRLSGEPWDRMTLVSNTAPRLKCGFILAVLRTISKPARDETCNRIWTVIRTRRFHRSVEFSQLILDSHLKANGIHEGVQSYSKFVALAIATRERWGNFQ